MVWDRILQNIAVSSVGEYLFNFFAFCRTCRGSTITFQCFWWFFEIKDIFLTVVDEIGAFYSLKNFLLFYSHGVSWNHDRWKSNVSKHLLLIFMFIWSQTEYCRKRDVLQRSLELGFRLLCKLWLGLVLAGTSKLMCLRACVLGKTGLQNHSKMQWVAVVKFSPAGWSFTNVKFNGALFVN